MSSNIQKITREDTFQQEGSARYPELTHGCKQCTARYDNAQDATDCASRQLISDQQYEAVKEIAEGAVVVLQLKSGQSVVGKFTGHGQSDQDSQRYVEIDGQFIAHSFVSIQVATEKEVAIWNAKYGTTFQASNEIPINAQSLVSDDSFETDLSAYNNAMRVNEKLEFETGWSFLKKVSAIPFLVLVLIESLLYTIVTFVATRFMSKKSIFRQDRRLWPVSLLFYMASTGAMFAKRNSMKWQAIEFIYNWEKNTNNLNFYDAMLTRFWGSFENVVATRNRFRNLKKELFWEIVELIASGKKSVTITSLAAGSARGPIEVLTYFLKKGLLALDQVTIHLVDNDPEAYSFAVALAESEFEGLSKRIIFWQSTISSKPDGLASLSDYLNKAKPDIVEMVGFTDYMSNEKAIAVMRVINDSLKNGGIFITNNVAPNDERLFLELVVTWKMVNRTEKQMIRIFNEAGFFNIRTVWEPTAIQTVYSCRK